MRKVGEVADAHRIEQFDSILGSEDLAGMFARDAAEFAIVAKELRQTLAQCTVCRVAQCHEAIEGWCDTGRGSCGREMIVEPSHRAAGDDIENLIADRDPGARRLLGSAPAKYPERQVLNREIAGPVIRRVDPTLKGWVERGIGQRHGKRAE